MTAPSDVILLVEDNEDDVFVFERAARQARLMNPIRVAPTGQAAIEYLSGEGEYADRARFPLPFLIFLDLKLPYVNGFDVLTWIRKRPEFDPTVVVVLTSSDEERDHSRAYKLGARSYLVKPPAAADLLELLRSLEPYWARFPAPSPVALGPA